MDIIITLVFALMLLGIFLHFVPIGLWISALAADVHVGIFTLVGMRMRRVPPSKIVLPLIKANRRGSTSMSINWRRIIWRAAMLISWSTR